MKFFSAFLSGLLFSVGLILAGMTRPAKIIGFLDFFGQWDPTLLFVMAGAVVVYALCYRLVLKRRAPLFAPSFDLPSSKKLDAPLLLGAAAFGIGWGLSGFCPGPALVASATGARSALLFLAAMLAGAGVHHVLFKSSGNGRNDDACG